MPVPSYSNTGVQNTASKPQRGLAVSVSGNDYFIDYLAITLHVETSISGVALAWFTRYFWLEIEEAQIQRGLNGYQQMLAYPSGVKVMYDGMPGMGIHIVIPGFALYCAHMDFDVFRILSMLERDKVRYNVSRVDIALDSNVDFSYFLEKVEKRRYHCKYRTVKRTLNQDNRGTIYFGKRGNMTMIRIYDKALEQGVDGIWTRIEMESRGEACMQVLAGLKNGEMGWYFLGHLRFVEKRSGNMSRAKTDRVWEEVLKNPIARKKVKRVKADKTLEWFVFQVAPVVKALERDYGPQFVRQCIDAAKMSKRQIRERFDLRLVKAVEAVNGNIGERVKMKEEYKQMVIDELERRGRSA